MIFSCTAGLKALNCLLTYSQTASSVIQPVPVRIGEYHVFITFVITTFGIPACILAHILVNSSNLGCSLPC